ncbi:DEAD/DEAH box helicase [Crocosphaera sp. UHCC 0190]|uniref:DEAD/DEAH box helicase n=1 Tax=Crocosphaera sp. UHCC 0190 TaxID=3110246 RepID=UPI002B20316A|nr:DEAD/DEAH box helicase [Crocosphaera sp. UHCC 0190]MEA5509993.1 DEAD/DEAH box helicase [Crocosphaera sp. UHCC 0190]
MSTLHGIWLKNNHQSNLFVWGETWRTLSLESYSDDVINLHPFGLNKLEFFAYLNTQNIKINQPKEANWDSIIITLPSQKIPKQKQIIPLFSVQLLEDEKRKKTVFLNQWKLEGIYLNVGETINFLSQLPLAFSDNSENYIGQDLKFWTHLYRWSLDLLSRGKYLPGILPQENGNSQGLWYPLLDSVIDQAQLAKFTQLMPIACLENDELTLVSERLLLQKQAIILDFLSTIIDHQIRLFSPLSITPNIFIQKWLQSLTTSSSKIVASDTDIKRLSNALNNWTSSLDDYLITPSKNKLGINQFRVCFKLEIPPSNLPNSGDINWTLKYCLQALDDAEFIIDAQTIWQHPVKQLVWQNRTIENPQETLLKGLGLASRLYFIIKESLQEASPTSCQLDPIQVYEFIRSIAETLKDNGLGVMLPPSLAKGVEEKRLGISLTAGVEAKKGERLSLKSLLNYQLNLAIGETKISQKDFEKLLAKKSPLVEVNGEWIALQPTDVKAAQTILNQSYEPLQLSVEDALRLSTGDNSMLAKLPVTNFETTGDLAQLINSINNNESIKPIENPPGFKGQLRPYQQRGVGWLAFLEKWGLGACLADDMGLGKTPQLLGFLLYLKDEDMLIKPTLIVCPTSVLNNWEREVKKFAPTLSTLIHHGDKRSKGKDFLKAVNKKNLVITSYALIYRDLKSFEQVEWQGIVLDEAQNIKNPQAKQSQALRQLSTQFRVALTGTPVENRLIELWSILDFLNPGFLGTQQFFRRRFATPIEKYGDKESLQIMRSLVRPFILRRLKTDRDIIQDLPEKQEMTVFCGLSSEQAKLYQQLVDNSLIEIEEQTGIQRRGLILSLLLKLKQICNHPGHFLKEKALDSGQKSGKLLRLEEMLEEVIEEGDHALIFTQFSEWGKLLQPYLKKKFSQDVLFLYGATRREKRQEMIDQFQNDPKGPQIFILSLKAGGTGLNLTRANHVFHIDRWWNPAVENQATDRAFRLGQKRNVQVHKFVCTGTLEERINEMLESKQQLAEQTVDTGEQWLTELDTDQLRNLLLLDRDSIIDD